MREVQQVLFATDFSEYSHQARDFACQLAEKFGARLHVIHVVHNLAIEVPEFGMGLAFPGYLENLSEVKHELAAKAQVTLAKELTENFKEDHNVLFAIQFGIPDVEIVKYANQNAIDLIVMGTHGRSGISHVLVGSVAERVIEKATCPVTTVRS